MNSIRRARRRPRVRSANFRALEWLLTREAALHVLYPRYLGTDAEVKARLEINRCETYALRGLAAMVLRMQARPGAGS